VYLFIIQINISVNKVTHTHTPKNKRILSNKHAKRPNEQTYMQELREVFTRGGNLLQKSFVTQIFDRFSVINF